MMHFKYAHPSFPVMSTDVGCDLQMSYASLSFQLLSLSGRIGSSQSSLLVLDRQTMFVLVSLFLVCPAHLFGYMILSPRGRPLSSILGQHSSSSTSILLVLLLVQTSHLKHALPLLPPPSHVAVHQLLNVNL